MSINFTTVSPLSFVPYVSKHCKERHGIGMLVMESFGVGDASGGVAQFILAVPNNYGRRYVLRLRSILSTRTNPTTVNNLGWTCRLFLSYLLKGGATRIIDGQGPLFSWTPSVYPLPGAAVNDLASAQAFCEQVGDIEAQGTIQVGAVWYNEDQKAYSFQVTFDLLDDIAPK